MRIVIENIAQDAIEDDIRAALGTIAEVEKITLVTQCMEPLALQAIQSAVAREMESRGYRTSPTPDLLLDFNGKLEERTDIESTPAPMYGPGWGYGGWYGAPWGGGPEVRTRHYKVGTLVMDIVSHAKRQSVYQGGVEGIVWKEMLQDPRAALTDAVARVFEGYPFVAGQSTPIAPVYEKR